MARVMIAVLSAAFLAGCAEEDPAARDAICCLDAVSGELLRAPGCGASATVAEIDGSPALAVPLCRATTGCVDRCASLQSHAPDYEGCMRACSDPDYHAL